MTDEQKRIAIAEFCGWKKEYTFISQELGSRGDEVQAWISPTGETSACRIPDYLNDLNAMNQAEEHLHGEQWAKYFELLQRHGKATGVRATATERADALLKTIGKLTD